MKVLWLSITPIKEAATELGIKADYNGAGWMTALINLISENEEIELSIICMMHGIKEMKVTSVNNVKYFLVPFDSKKCSKFGNRTADIFRDILKGECPDIIHVYGTETPQTLAMINAAKGNCNVVVQITGLVDICAKNYYHGIPNKWIRKRSIGDILRRGGIKKEKRRFQLCAKYEIEAFSKAKYVLGRTSWDRAHTKLYNQNLKYYYNNDILRQPFYEKQWNIKDIERYSVFMSQGSYPIKGLHLMLRAMPYIVKKYPETKLYIAGGNIVNDKSLKDKIKMTTYGKFIRNLINELSLKNKVIFLGNLDEEEMRDRYVKSHIFISPSVMENDPNSLGEARILGVPSIASYVGGVPDRVENGVDGFIYNCNDYDLISYYICEIFNSDDLAESFSKECRKKALDIYDREKNVKKLVNIYEDIIKNG